MAVKMKMKMRIRMRVFRLHQKHLRHPRRRFHHQKTKNTGEEEEIVADTEDSAIGVLIVVVVDHQSRHDGRRKEAEQVEGSTGVGVEAEAGVEVEREEGREEAGAGAGHLEAVVVGVEVEAVTKEVEEGGVAVDGRSVLTDAAEARAGAGVGAIVGVGGRDTTILRSLQPLHHPRRHQSYPHLHHQSLEKHHHLHLHRRLHHQ